MRNELKQTGCNKKKTLARGILHKPNADMIFQENPKNVSKKIFIKIHASNKLFVRRVVTSETEHDTTGGRSGGWGWVGEDGEKGWGRRAEKGRQGSWVGKGRRRRGVSALMLLLLLVATCRPTEAKKKINVYVAGFFPVSINLVF